MNLNKKTLYGTDARKLLMEGIEDLHKSVASTLGPSGKNVLIEKNMGVPHVTKDGVTVAMEQNFSDQFKNMGAQVIKQAAIRTGEEAGDGTTTSIVLANAMIEVGVKLIAAGINPVKIKRSLDRLVKSVVEKIDGMAEEVSGLDNIKSVATVSANNDAELGSLIAEAAHRVGKSGHITVEDSKTLETTLEVVEGMHLKSGMISPYFVTDTGKMQAELSNPIVLLHDNKINDMQQIVFFMEKARQQDRPLLIIADGVEGSALSTLTMNHLKGVVKVCAIKTPGVAQTKMEKLKDIAAFTGGEIISKDTGKDFINTDVSELGSAEKIVVKKNETIIMNGNGDEAEIKGRVEDIHTAMETADEREETDLRQRVSSLNSAAAIIKLGAATDVEKKELKDRVDDAINATQAAMEEGIVPGGGTCLLKIRQVLEKGDEIASGIIENALESPFRGIVNNTGKSPDGVIHEALQKNDDWYGYDAGAEEFGDMKNMGVVDPAKVTRIALQNAASVAGMVFITDCVMIQDNTHVVNEKQQMT